MLVFYSIAIICLTIIAILYIDYKRYECTIKTYNANVQGWMLVKGDHICDRVGKYSKCVKLHNNLISAEDFLSFINKIELIVRDELVYRPYREEDGESKSNINKVDGSKRNKQRRIK